jgi:hypothetical protein
MKIMGFVHREEIYESGRDEHYPFLLGFSINYKIVAFKDLSPNH